MYCNLCIQIKMSFFIRLEFGTAPSAEAGAPPITTNDILAMISPEGESVPLLKVHLGCIFVIVLFS